MWDDIIYPHDVHWNPPPKANDYPGDRWLWTFDSVSSFDGSCTWNNRDVCLTINCLDSDFQEDSLFNVNGPTNNLSEKKLEYFMPGKARACAQEKVLPKKPGSKITVVNENVRNNCIKN